MTDIFITKHTEETCWNEWKAAGKKQFTGELTGFADGVITLAADTGETVTLKQKEVAIIRPLIEFDEEDLQDDIPVDDQW